MEVLAYVFDTNVIADFLRGRAEVIQRLSATVDAGHVVGLCPPVHFETTRGLLKTDSRSQLAKYYSEIFPMLVSTPMVRDDWDEAARLWAQTQRQGRQFSDIDLLLAAMTIRLDAILVTADEDFNALPLRRENWRA